MINGKNLVKLQAIRSQSRIHITTTEQMTKIEAPASDVHYIKEVLKKISEAGAWPLIIEKSKARATVLSNETVNPESKTTPLTFSLPQLAVGRIRKKPKKLVTLPKVQAPSYSDVYNSTVHFLQLSNGIEVATPKNLYRYFIGSGNNDALVSRIMRSKKGWVKVYTPQTANFIWSQVKKKEFMNLIPISQDTTEKTRKSGVANCQLFQNETFVQIFPLDLVKPNRLKVYNRLERNSELSSKKRLFHNLRKYYESINSEVFDHIPLTFHIRYGSRDPNFEPFKQKFLQFEAQVATQVDKHLTNVWLVKPGELTNRGIGISVCSTLKEIIYKIDNPESPAQNRTYIIQKYIYRPLLYKNRKFDIRCYTLITCFNCNLQAFFYKEGYLRTSAAEFSLEDTHDKFIHLTNDAVQKRSDDYGKFEDGNKLSYKEFQEYLDKNVDSSVNFSETILPKIEKLVKDSVKSTYKLLNPKERLHTFEILGYDFMIDEFYNPWLIEVNTNPCLALSGAYLSDLIPRMLRDAFQIALDQMFISEPVDINDNKFIMIFNEAAYCGS